MEFKNCFNDTFRSEKKQTLSVLKLLKRIADDNIVKKACCICVHFYDRSFGPFTNYGCCLGRNVNEGLCDEWQENGVRKELEHKIDILEKEIRNA